MRFVLILMLMVFSFGIEARTLNLQDFKHLEKAEQIEILKAYKSFIIEYQKNAPELAKARVEFNFNLISEAIAAGEFSCFYAGWPSKSVSVTRGGKKKELCNNPAKNNPNYENAQKNNGCKSSELACNPALFGTGLCVDISTQKKRNLAFNQCEQKFASSGKNLSSVAEEIVSGKIGAEADEMFRLVSDVCSSGFQSSTGMCRNLENRVAEITELKPEKAVEVAEAPASEEVQVNTPSLQPQVSPEVKAKPTHESAHVTTQRKPVQLPDETYAMIRAIKDTEKLSDTVAHVHTVDCEEDHDHIKTPEKAPQKTPERKPPQNFQRIFCEKPVAQVQNRTRAELDRILKENNVEIVSEISNEQYLWDFVGELQRFPATLRRELAAAGGKIHIFDDSVTVKKGVTADPSWNRGEVIEGKEGRRWASLPGSGGWTSTSKSAAVPTRIAINKLTAGPSSNHGCTSLFLHEHGHMLGNRFGEGFGLHNQPEFKALLQDPAWMPVMSKLCANNYCNQNNEADREEAFAELFAYYHTCEESRQSLEAHFPAAAEYMRTLTTLRGRRPAGAPR